MNKLRCWRGPGLPRRLPPLLALWALLLLGQTLGRHHQIAHAWPTAGGPHVHWGAGLVEQQDCGHDHRNDPDQDHHNTLLARHTAPAPALVGWAQGWSGPHEAGDEQCHLAGASCGADAPAPMLLPPPAGATPSEPLAVLHPPPRRAQGGALPWARGPPGWAASWRG